MENYYIEENWNEEKIAHPKMFIVKLYNDIKNNQKIKYITAH